MSFVVALSFKSSLSLVPSQLKLEPTDGIVCRHSAVSRGESEHKAQTACQLVPMSPVAKKCSVDRRIRSVAVGANTTGTVGFLQIKSEYRGMGKHRDHAILLDHVTY